jgi:hypothetical protein
MHPTKPARLALSLKLVIALRQLALRATADPSMRRCAPTRDDHAIQRHWAAGERVLLPSADPLKARRSRSASPPRCTPSGMRSTSRRRTTGAAAAKPRDRSRALKLAEASA